MVTWNSSGGGMQQPRLVGILCLSQRLGEIPTDAPEINEILAMQQQAARKLEASRK